MVRILDYTGTPRERTTTVADIRGLRTIGAQLTQTTAGTAEEAAAADAAGIDMIACLGPAVPEVRQGSSTRFVSAAIDFQGAVTPDDLLRDAFAALEAGADAVITARSLAHVEHLAADDLPVMGHLGFVPKKATLYGGVRTVGKTAAEAAALWADFRRLEDAGAFSVECELIPANLMAAIQQRTGLATVSLGSGPHADVMFLFQNDICGEGGFVPRHARTYADLDALHEQIRTERIRALGEWKADVAAGAFPNDGEISQTPDDELAAFLDGLD
ncbi:MAG: 3-methyl-2-oxobutanoate hydroxymethyltransferase [Actinomycetota bacterium]